MELVINERTCSRCGLPSGTCDCADQVHNELRSGLGLPPLDDDDDDDDEEDDNADDEPEDDEESEEEDMSMNLVTNDDSTDTLSRPSIHDCIDGKDIKGNPCDGDWSEKENARRLGLAENEGADALPRPTINFAQDAAARRKNPCVNGRDKHGKPCEAEAIREAYRQRHQDNDTLDIPWMV